MRRRWQILQALLWICVGWGLAAADLAAEEGLIACWDFDDGPGQTVRNRAGTANVGTVVGQAAWVRRAEGYALDFNGVDTFVECGNSPALDFGTGDFSIEVVLSLRGPQEANGILTKADSLGSANGWKLSTSSRGLRFRMGDGKDYRNIFAMRARSYGWQHAVLTKKGDSLEFYCDGALRSTANGVGAININSSGYPVRIGHKAGYRFLDGLIDLIRVYQRPLSPEEIQKRYRAFHAGTQFLRIPLSQTAGKLRLKLGTHVVRADRDTELDVLCLNSFTLEERLFHLAKGPDQSGNAEIVAPQFFTPGTYRVDVRVRRGGRITETETRQVRINTNVLSDGDLAHQSPSPGDAVLLTRLTDHAAGRGKPFAYRTETEVRGVGIELSADDAVILSPKLAGNYAIYVAVDYPCPRLLTKCGAVIRRHGGGAAPGTSMDRNVREVFGGAGSFEKGDLFLVKSLATQPVRLYYVRLIRLSAEEYSLARYINQPLSNRHVIYNNDGYSDFFGATGCWSKERLCQLVDRYRGTDTEIFEFAALVSGAVNFPSRYATYFGEGHLEGDVWANRDALLAAKFYRAMDDAGLPVFKTLVSRAREIGLPIYGSLRMSAYYPERLSNDSGYIPLNGDRWHEHPEWRIQYRNRAYTHRMSYAWQAVREERLGVLGEMVQMGCDGVSLDFCRYPQILGYDVPLVQGFEKEHGLDPRKLPDDDERWLTYRCSVLNDFFRNLRNRMKALGAERDRSVSIVIRLPATGYRAYGFDPETWVQERLVDILVPHYPGLEKDFDVRPWVEMVKGTDVKVYPGMTVTKFQSAQTELTDAEIKAGIKPGTSITMSPDDYRRKTSRRYRRGGHGTYIFNNWNGRGCLNELGDKRYLTRWSCFEDPANQQAVNAVVEGAAVTNAETFAASGPAATDVIRKELKEVEALEQASFKLTLTLKDNATVAGNVAIVAEPIGFIPLRIDFYIDGKNVSTERASPYWCFGDFQKWDTRTVANGKHRIEAIALRADNGVISRAVTVTVQN